MRGSVNQNRDIKLTGNLCARLNVKPGDRLTFGAGLFGDKAFTEHAGRQCFHFVRGVRDFDAARFAAAARMNLRLDGINGTGKTLCGFFSLGCTEGRKSGEHRKARGLQKLFCLIFVNFHFAVSAAQAASVKSKRGGG